MSFVVLFVLAVAVSAIAYKVDRVSRDLLELGRDMSDAILKLDEDLRRIRRARDVESQN